MKRFLSKKGSGSKNAFMATIVAPYEAWFNVLTVDIYLLEFV
jgi:hypothetical protein